MMNETIDARTVLGIIRDREEHLKHLKDEKMIKEMEIAELEKAIKFLEGKKDEVLVDSHTRDVEYYLGKVASEGGKRDKPAETRCDFPGCSSLASHGHSRCLVHFYKHRPEKKTTGDTLEELV